jgi:hypothetical protein
MAPRLAPITTLAAGAVLSMSPLGAQAVLIAPHLVTLDHATRGGQVTLYNPGNTDIEVEVGLGYGLPATDSLGEFSLTLSDPGAREATSWIAAYPRRVRLRPQQRQAVRLLASPRANLDDGEYWARLVVTTRNAAPAETGAEAANIAIGLNVELRTILPLLYRKGRPTVSAALGEPVLEAVDRDSLDIIVPMEPLGNAAFLGSLKLSLNDASGAILSETEMPVSLYAAAAPRIKMARPSHFADRDTGDQARRPRVEPDSAGRPRGPHRAGQLVIG